MINNQVVLEGQIINSVRTTYNKQTAQQILYFVIAVPREYDIFFYNKDENNYFYCYASERVLGTSIFEEFKKRLHTYDKVRIKGILDNMPHHRTTAKEVNYRAKYCYTSCISIMDYKVLPQSPEPLRSEEIITINSLRNQFGKDIEVVFTDDAFDKDYNGFEDRGLPDY